MKSKRGPVTLARMLVRGMLLPTILPCVLIFLVTCVICFRFAIAQSLSYGRTLSDVATSLIAERINGAEQLAVELPSLNASSSANSLDSLYMLIRQSNAPGELPFPLQYFEHYMRINRLLNTTYLINNPYINGVYVITDKGRLFSFSQVVHLPPESEFPMQDYLQYLGSGYTLIARGMCRQFDRLSENRRVGTDSLLTLVSPLHSAAGPFAVVLIDLNSQLMSISGADQGSSYLLLNGEVVYSNGNADLPDPLDAGDGVRYDIMSQTVITRSLVSRTYGVTLITTQPVSLWGLLLNTLPVCAVITALSIALSAWLTRRRARRISQPVINLVQTMNRSQPLSHEEVDYQGIEEFETLYRQYNILRAQINSHVEQSYARELAVTRMRLQALSAQIDMHFLYNTFDCMHSLCLIRGVDDVAAMTKALSDMFHYISDSEPLVLVSHEVRHICDYRTIQSMRFQDKYALLIDIDDALLCREIPRLLLQPLVENAYKHGLRGLPTGQINVWGRWDGRSMRFAVQDDGAGMSRQRLDEVKDLVDKALRGEPIVDSDCVGLINIASRLYLRYRDRAWLTLSSRQGEGTRVDIVIGEG